MPMYSACNPLKEGVSPFGHLWIKACSQLPITLRSVPRPSSPPGAKASTECPFVVQYTALFQANLSHSTTTKLERDFAAYPPCTGTIYQIFYTHCSLFNYHHLLGTSRKQPKRPQQKPENISGRQVIPCNIHGHHNRNHCIIIHLNTSKFFTIISSGFYSLPRSDNPSQKTSGQLYKMLTHLASPTRASKRTKTYSH